MLWTNYASNYPLKLIKSVFIVDFYEKLLSLISAIIKLNNVYSKIERSFTKFLFVLTFPRLNNPENGTTCFLPNIDNDEL